jgi:hypothetical protein
MLAMQAKSAYAHAMTKTAEQYIQEITSKGGKARAEALSAKKRKAIAKKAAKARWAKRGSSTQSAPGR